MKTAKGQQRGNVEWERPKGPTGLKGKRINSTTASSVQCPVPVRESDSVLVVPLRGDRYNR